MPAEIGPVGMAEPITGFVGEGLQLIVDYAGFGTTTVQAVETLGIDGGAVRGSGDAAAPGREDRVGRRQRWSCLLDMRL